MKEPIWITPAEMEKSVNLTACQRLDLFIEYLRMNLVYYIAESNMMNKYSTYKEFLQALFYLRMEDQLFRQMTDVLL